MNKATAFLPDYVGDYLQETAMLTSAAEHGAYSLLRRHYWANGGPLRDDDKTLARLACCTAKMWRALRPKIERFFVVADGLWRHTDLDRKLTSAKEASQRRTAGSLRANQERWHGKDKPLQNNNIYFRNGVRADSLQSNPIQSNPKRIPPKPPKVGRRGLRNFGKPTVGGTPSKPPSKPTRRS
jgi:uncharacterized protein YdaU (DUF1376 family)